ncbi:2-succinyl-6-hydroxy-2,4-cyclohexadiene-1-carboxylate synthase [Aquibacillus sediminis]|uniref:2-succinyl-6-hydroxy-2, 4-cyclohexadiene-1-carboxylate synthase n=1 Tax=Aquibacillus sediminis TaxID=2574734 RepID=UPI0011084590|nr:2-succinyl-6-hydroxy-2,4-cyclohexadiene-1-carboxylate synthase [Aquibacillus sediminis]
MYYSIGQKQYWLEQHGQGDPLVLLHGFTGSTRTWDAFVEKWKDKYKVLTIDLPGHGKTQVNKIVQMEEVCDDLHTLLRGLGYPPVHVIGYSMGGRTALSFAMMYPNDVASLMLESASPGLRESKQQLARQKNDERLARKIETEGLRAFVDYWEKIPLFETQHMLPQSIQTRLRQERLSQFEQGLAASLRGMGTGQQPSWWDQLSNLSIDVLLIVGALDSKFVDIAKQMSDSIKSSRLEIVAQAGHAVHVEQAQKFDTIVSDFLS